MEKQNFLIIGSVAAGMSAASRIRVINPEANIRTFQKSGFVSYIACGIPYLIAGVVPSSSKLVAYNVQFFREKRKIDISLHHEVLKISPSAKTVQVKNLETGEEKEYTWDRLLISTGARPVLPPIKGINLKGIFSIRLLEDGIAIQDYMEAKSPARGLIVGAGNIGLEMAEAFSARGLAVTVVEKMPEILGSMDGEINEVVERELRDKNVTLLKARGVVEFTGDSSGVKRAVLDNGETIDTDIVIMGTGIKPNVEIAREAGVELGQTGAIKIDGYMRTNIPDIFAAGDCAEAYHLVYERNVYMPLGTTANKQGRLAGENMAGGNVRFPGIVGTSVFKVFDLEIARTGLSEKDAMGEGINFASNVIEQFSRAHYYPGVSRIRVKLVADKKTGKLLGAQMVGREGVSKRIDVFAVALTAGMHVRDVASLDLGYAPPFAPVYDPVLIAGSELLKKLDAGN